MRSESETLSGRRNPKQNREQTQEKEWGRASHHLVDGLSTMRCAFRFHPAFSPFFRKNTHGGSGRRALRRPPPSEHTTHTICSNTIVMAAVTAVGHKQLRRGDALLPAIVNSKAEADGRRDAIGGCDWTGPVCRTVFCAIAGMMMMIITIIINIRVSYSLISLKGEGESFDRLFCW